MRMPVEVLLPQLKAILRGILILHTHKLASLAFTPPLPLLPS